MKAYEDWIKDIKDDCKKILRDYCNASCRGKNCLFKDLLNCCSEYWIDKTKYDFQANNDQQLSAFVKKCCDSLCKVDAPWLGLFPESEKVPLISQKTLNKFKLQALAQFFLIYILRLNEPTQHTLQQPFRIDTFHSVSDLKEKIKPLLQPNIHRAIFLQALTEARIPVLNIEIPSVFPGAPTDLYLILKNASLLPLFWPQTSSIQRYKIPHNDYLLSHEKDWFPIGDLVSETRFHPTSSALLPGESYIVSIPWTDDLRRPKPKYKYFIQINYRTADNLFVADIYEISWPTEFRPFIRFVKKIPYGLG
ncbi:MAG TPA: hypothetical protein VHY08_11170 [Bacillota bacterium]|nr:hypothetical protein [Bacillota bacterium]